jgi:DMSO/TMAO reductase YedYZ molybdopterin-dependent catalytic subunit
VTPTRLFFVRNHFDMPAVDAATWRLRIDGLVDRPISLSLAQLQSYPQRTVFATMECAGNGRSYLKEPQAGVQWGAGAIAHAEWTGVPLQLVLKECGVKSSAVEVVFEGADRGQEPDQTAPENFARSLPMKKALDRNTLIVLRMNGEPLTPEHGFPARLVVPGWYGVASVKWLTRMTATDRPFHGYYQDKKYTIQAQTPSGVEKVIVQKMAVKSEMIRPREGEKLGIGTHRVFGVAWAGEEPIQKVEVSTDDGTSWGEADLIGLQAPYSWALWEYLWEVAIPGPYSLMARATSARGETQPAEHDPLHGGYVIHFARPRHVEVDPTAGFRARDGGLDLQAVVYDMNAFAELNAATPLDVFAEHMEGGGI